MDEIRWGFHKINWTLYRDDDGQWMAFSSASDSHRTIEKKNMESWLTAKGLLADDIEKLFRDVEMNGESAITVSRLHETPGLS
jgi:hypothetical protein